MDCGTSTVKYILFIFNTLVSIIGLTAIVYGVIVLNSIGTIEVNGQVGFPPQALMPMILITIGSVVVFISFLGCCGAIRESVCMTMFYAIFLLILLIVQLIIIVMLFTHRDEFRNAMGNVIDNAFEQEKYETGVFDAIQRSLKCCGSHGMQDYVIIGKLPPSSCCANDNCLNPLNIYGGCREKFQDLMTGSTEIAKYFGLGLIAIEAIGFVFACCLANNIRIYKRREMY